MGKIEELKQAADQLEKDLAALGSAESDLAMWKYHDSIRGDGSSYQDARHEQIGRDAEDLVDNAKCKVERQKALISELLNSI